MNLGKGTKVTKVIPAAGAGTGTTNGSTLDMSGFDGVMFIGGAIGTVNAGNYFKLQQDEDSAMGAAADLLGTKITPTVNGYAVKVDLYRPLERYVRIVCVLGASATLGDVYAIQYRGSKDPQTDATGIESETHISPAEGTA
jgi:hypothetical protein